MDWLEGTILEHEGIEGPATSMLPSLWEARIRAAHNAEVERVTAEYQKGFNDLVDLALSGWSALEILYWLHEKQAIPRRYDDAKRH